MKTIEGELAEMRERMVLGVALMERLAEIALRVSPELCRELETIAATGHACVMQNLEKLTALIDANFAPLRAAS